MPTQRQILIKRMVRISRRVFNSYSLARKRFRMCGGHTANIFQRRNTSPAMAAPSIKSVESVSGAENILERVSQGTIGNEARLSHSWGINGRTGLAFLNVTVLSYSPEGRPVSASSPA